MMRILVTPRSITAAGEHPALEALQQASFEVVLCGDGKQPTEAQLIAALPGCVGYLAGVEPVTAAVLEAADALKVIARNGVGVDNVDLQAAAQRGIVVKPAIGANAQGVAELAIAAMFNLARAIPSSDRAIKTGGWKRTQGIELQGRTLGILGCGQIGRRLARMALGLDMRVLAYDVKPDDSFAPSPRFAYASLDEVIRQADVLSLHCPPPADGSVLLDAQRLDQTLRGVIIINTARHQLIDPEAALERLQSGHIFGMALDVFETEPPQMTALLSHERVICTPHVGGFTGESIDRAVQVAVQNLLEVLCPGSITA